MSRNERRIEMKTFEDRRPRRAFDVGVSVLVRVSVFVSFPARPPRYQGKPSVSLSASRTPVSSPLGNRKWCFHPAFSGRLGGVALGGERARSESFP